MAIERRCSDWGGREGGALQRVERRLKRGTTTRERIESGESLSTKVKSIFHDTFYITRYERCGTKMKATTEWKCL